MIPRMLRPTTHRDLRVELFGERFESPVLVAPVGVQTIFHGDKETGVAQVAAEIGVGFVLSTASSASIEEVAEASGEGKRWFQLYWPQDEEITVSVWLPFLGMRLIGVKKPMELVKLMGGYSCCNGRRKVDIPSWW